MLPGEPSSSKDPDDGPDPRSTDEGEASPSTAEALLALARTRVAQDAPGSVEVATRALAAAERGPRDDLVAEAELTLGEALAVAGDAPHAAMHLENAASRLAQPARRAEALRVLANVRGNLLGETELALETLSVARSAAERAGDPTMVARVLGSQGTLLGRLGRGEDARVALEAAIAGLTNSGDLGSLARQYANLGFLHVQCARYAEAHAALTRAIELSERVGQRMDAQVATSSMAIALAGLGRADEARAMLAAAERRFTRDDDRHTWLQLPLDAARVHLLLGEPRSARAALEQGYAAVAAAGMRMLEAEFLELMIQTAEAMGDTAAALATAKRLRETERAQLDAELARKTAQLRTSMRLDVAKREKASLVAAQRDLETRVAERTAQLAAANAALAASEQRFRDLTELSSDWFWEQDEELRFVYLSNEGLERSRYDAATMIGKRRWELGIEGLSEADWEAHKALLARRESFHDLVFRRRNLDGEMGWFSVSGRPVFDAQGRFIGYRGIGRDITRQVEIEQQLRRHQRLEAMGRLAGGVAHELNNIIGVVAGHTHLLRDGDERANESLDAIDLAIERASALVRQILAFSRGQRMERKPHDVAAALGDAVRFLRAAVPAMIKIRTRIADGAHIASSSATAIHQIVVNLGTNARDAISGHGTIDIELTRLAQGDARLARLTGIGPGPYLRIAVRDDGAGMDPATLDRIFEPFFTTKSVGAGTGLGLSVVHGIVHEHGGVIDVASDLGRGTLFEVFLPAIDGAPDAKPVERAPVAVGGGQRILLVDDDDSLVFLVRRLLERLGYHVEAHGDAREVLAALARDPQAYDALVTDLAMPGMSGLDLAERVLTLRPGLPIVVMSGYVREQDAQRAERLGIGEICDKPTLVEGIAAALHERLAARRTPPATT